MISNSIFEECVQRAALAPTVHNTQPARWLRDGNVLTLFCETNVGLAIGDPSGRDAGLSCGAVLEGMILALSAHNITANVVLTDTATYPDQGLVAVAHLTLVRGVMDGLHTQLENRFTWRGAFTPEPAKLFGWTRTDARLVLDDASRTWLADRNDQASFEIMQNAEFRHELVNWMRLRDNHPRAGLDGMNRESMRMSKGEARVAPFALLKFWQLLNTFGVTKGMVAERQATLTAPVIALFYSDINERPITSGRAYLRLCLEAASLGLAGWPMAALSDHPTISADVSSRFGIPSDRRLVQAIRFGVPTGDAPPRARRPLAEVLR